MKKTFLTYILAVLMVVQSALALADAHSLHQPEETHNVGGVLVSVQGGHDLSEHGSGFNHNSHNDNSIAEVQLASEEESDCQHCCHCLCNCSANSILPNASLGLPSVGPLSEATPYCISMQPLVLKSLLRPPIFF